MIDKSNRILTQEQRGMLVGMILGDGSIVQNEASGSCTLHVDHCARQRDYLYFKYKLFEQFIPSGVRPVNDKKSGYSWFKFSTVVVPEFQYFRDLFYVSGRKIVTKQIMNMLTVFGLALWYMDDGTCDKKRKQYRISTCCFTLEEHKMMREMLRRKFDIWTTIGGYICSKTQKKYYHLHICRRSFEQFEKLVGLFIVPCMEYKIGYFKVSPQRLYANRLQYFEVDDIARSVWRHTEVDRNDQPLLKKEE